MRGKIPWTREREEEEKGKREKGKERKERREGSRERIGKREGRERHMILPRCLVLCHILISEHIFSHLTFNKSQCRRCDYPPFQMRTLDEDLERLIWCLSSVIDVFRTEMQVFQTPKSILICPLQDPA